MWLRRGEAKAARLRGLLSTWMACGSGGASGAGARLGVTAHGGGEHRRRRIVRAVQAHTGGAGRARGRGGGGLERRRCVQASGGERWRRGGERVGRRRLGVRGERNRGWQRGQETYMTGRPAIFLNAGRSDA